jgi:type I restriction enzyme S subunit
MNSDTLIPFTELIQLNPRSKVSGTRVPFIGMEDVSNEGTLLQVREREIHDYSAGLSIFQNHDVLFAKITPCMENGKGAYVQGLKGAAGLGSTEFHVLRARPNVDPRYIFHWTRSRQFRIMAEKLMTGSAGQRRVQSDFFRKFHVPILSLPEQRRIADILDAINDRIGSTQRIADKELLAEDSLTTRLLNQHFGDACEPWTSGKLGDFIHLQRGFDITVAEQCPGNVPVVSSSGITSFHNIAMVRGPGVVTGRKGKLGDVYFVQSDFWPHDTSLWVTDFKGNDPQFIALLLRNLQLERFDAATSVPTLNRNTVHPIPVKIPRLPAQRRIIATLNHYSARKVALQNELTKLQQVRQGLMDDLLIGRIRVSTKAAGR